MSGIYTRLKKDIAYAKTSLSARDLLFEAHGAIKMARNLGEITPDEFLSLNEECVRNGINNSKYFN